MAGEELYQLGRIVNFDEKSRDYPITAALPRKASLKTKTWLCSQVLDQGREGACVGFGCAHELIAEPVPVRGVTNKLARELYYAAQRTDQWPGGEYPGATPRYSGSSVLAGAKVLQEQGYITEYRWGFGLEDLQMAVSNIGPAVIGVHWYSNMFRPDANGFIHVTGTVKGGHCILVRGIDVEKQAFLLHNSWGPTWGRNGTCWISFSDMGKLLAEEGEVMIPMRRQNPVKKALLKLRRAVLGE